MYIIKMIREANEMKEPMQSLNDCTSQQLKEQIQETKDHFNKKLEVLKKTNRNPCNEGRNKPN